MVNSSNILQALALRYQAKRAEAMTNLNVYFQNAVGVGEHPNVVEECDKLVKIIGDCDGNLSVIQNLSEQMNAQNEENKQNNTD